MKEETENPKDRRIYIILCIAILFIIGMVCAGYVGLRIIRHEKNQTSTINNLTGQVEYLEEKLNQTTDYYNFDTKYSDESFNYLAIGNSLTLITSWGRGICSTYPDNDYFNLVVKALENKYGNVVAYPYNFAAWEKYADNREKTYDLLTPYLSDKLDLVSIQLGENVSETGNYEQDLESLIKYIKEKAPNAEIIIIGDFWNYEKNVSRKQAASATNCGFADISEIIGKEEYQSYTGAVCYLEDGTEITVSEAAATHPGDKGMAYIADKVIEVLGIEN